MNIKLDELVMASGGVVVKSGVKDNVESISIDTRTIRAGEMFVAIKGAHHDGHSFLEEACTKGAMGVVVARDDAARALAGLDIAEEMWIIKVEDTVRALGDIAKTWRSRFNIPCVAIAGSNGKTTTKEMIAKITEIKGDTLKTEGNFNNLIGLPLTVFRWEEGHKIAVLEMGMNAKGEIKRLTEIANPTVGLVTNVNPAHLEKLQTLENVALAKGELFEGMSEEAVAVVNNDDPFVRAMGERFRGRKITFGTREGSDVMFANMKSAGLESVDIAFEAFGKGYRMHLPVPGFHNVMNALAAIAVAIALGIPLEEATRCIENFKPMKMRMERIQLSNGVRIVNDSYNANPYSMAAALKTVSGAKRAGRFIAVLGDMFELGPEAGVRHRELGENAARFGVDKLFVFGGYAIEVAMGAIKMGMSPDSVMIYPTMDDLKRAVSLEIRTGDVVLVKGSRGMQMERVVEFLKEKIGV